MDQKDCNPPTVHNYSASWRMSVAAHRSLNFDSRPSKHKNTRSTTGVEGSLCLLPEAVLNKGCGQGGHAPRHSLRGLPRLNFVEYDWTSGMEI